MKTFSLNLFYFFLATGFIACYDDFDNSTTAEHTEEPVVIIDTKTIGSVLNENGEEINDFTLLINDASYDVTGKYFDLFLSRIDKKAQHFGLIFNGEQRGFANIPLINYDVNKTQFKLFPQKQTSDLNTNQTISLNNKLAIKINPSHLVSGNNQITHVYFEDSDRLAQTGLWGKGNQNEDLFLEAELFFSFAENEKLKENQGIGIDIALDQLDGSKKYALFHYNTETNRWNYVDELLSANSSIEVFQTGNYKLASFSAAIFTEGEFLLDNKAVAFHPVELKNNSLNTINILTSSSGKWSSFLPLNSELSSTLVTECGDHLQTDVLKTEENGSFFTTEVSTTFETEFYNAEFQLVDCEGNDLEQPSIQLETQGNKNIFSFLDDQVDVYLPVCKDEFEVSAFDPAQEEESGVSLNWKKSIDDKLGVLTDCDNYEEGFNYIKIDGEVKTYDSFTFYYDSGKTYLTSDDLKIRLIFRGNETGVHTEDQINIYIDDPAFGTYGYLINCLQSDLGCGIDNFYVSHYDENVGGTLRASFSGEIWVERFDQSGNKVATNANISGQVIIKN